MPEAGNTEERYEGIVGKRKLDWSKMNEAYGELVGKENLSYDYTEMALAPIQKIDILKAKIKGIVDDFSSTIEATSASTQASGQDRTTLDDNHLKCNPFFNNQLAKNMKRNNKPFEINRAHIVADFIDGDER